MKQIIPGIIFLFFLLPQLQAQKLFVSNAQKLNLQSNSIEVLGKVGERMYTYRASKDGYYLDAFNDSMKLKATITLDFLPEKLVDIGFVPAEDGIKVVYQQSYNSQLVVYVAQLDADARLIKNPQAVDSVRTNWWATQERQFYFSSSTDNGYLIIYGLGSAKDDQLRLRTTLLNAALTPVAQREQLFDFKARPQFGQAALANDGTFYFCVFPGKELHFNGAKAWLYSLDADASKLHEIRIPRTDFFLSSPLIKLDQNQQQVYFCGSYSEKNKGQVEGLAIGVLAAGQDTLLQLQLVPFNEKLRSSSEGRRKKRAFNDYDVRDLIIKNEGGVLVVSEKFYYTHRQVQNYGMDAFYSGFYSRSPYLSNSITEYHYGDILVLDISADGLINRNTFIRKEQFVQEGQNFKSSYLMLNSGSALVFLFNDFSSRQTSVNAAVLSAEGSVQLRKLPHFKGMRAELMPLLGKQTGLTELVIPMISRNQLSFVRLDF